MNSSDSSAIENEDGEEKGQYCNTSFATESDLKRLKAKNSNQNTTRSTSTWVSAFDKWRMRRNISPLEEIPKESLDSILQLFFAEVCKRDGTDYEPDSLRTMLAALDRHLKNNGCVFSILRGREFHSCREVLNGKAIELQEKGLGKRKRRADAITEEEEEMLWNKGVLGGDTPLSLNLTSLYCISQHFGTRGCQEHHQIRVEDLKFVKKPGSDVTEYVEWVEGPTKTRQADLNKGHRRVTQRMFATSCNRCPVKFLEELISRRPPQLQNSGPLYLQPLKKPKKDVWYASQPVGVNKINGFMKMIAKLGELDSTNKHFTNHSVRKTTIRKLQKAGISNDKIISITGHKTEQSIQFYADTDLDDQRDISSKLSAERVPLSSRSMNDQLLNPESSRFLNPQFNFYNCSVQFGSSTSQANTQVSHLYDIIPGPSKKQKILPTSEIEDII